jgi:hypothetical protein
VEFELRALPVGTESFTVPLTPVRDRRDLRRGERAIDHLAGDDRETRRLDTRVAEMPRVHMNVWGRMVAEIKLDDQTLEARDPGHPCSLRSTAARGTHRLDPIGGADLEPRHQLNACAAIPHARDANRDFYPVGVRNPDPGDSEVGRLTRERPHDRHRAGVVQIRRAYANGRVKHTKTRLSRRAVPLQAIALEALDQLPPKDSPLLFPNADGGHLDFRNFNRRHWKPVQKAAGIEPLRDLYDLRHTYATFALRAGVPVFALSRFMGTSITMIDIHYGHLAVDSHEHAVSLLDALALERAVDAGWTSARRPAKPQRDTVSGPRERPSRRAVDARWTSRPEAVTPSAIRRAD